MSGISKSGRSSFALVLAFVAVLLGGFGLAGCNTLRGAGDDVENAGDAVKDVID